MYKLFQRILALALTLGLLLSLAATAFAVEADEETISIATAEELMEMLRTLPGAISPMGLLFDGEKKVRLAIDRALRGEERLLFHPCVNTATLAVSGADFFERLLPALGHEAAYVDMEGEDAE